MRLLYLFALALLFFGCVALPIAQEQKPQNQSQQPSGTTQPPQDAKPNQTEPTGTSEPEENITQPQDIAPQQNQPPPATTQPPANTSTSPASTLKSKEISYYSGAWQIYGTLYPSQSKTPTRAIILVPMLGKTRDSYPISLIESLHNQIPDAVVVALDMRGHGKSTNLGTWENFDSFTYMDMKTDILSAKKYLEPNYPDVETYQVVGASMGSTAAILAGAQDKTLTKIVMLSPGMKYKDVDITKAVDDYNHQVLLVASASDSYSVEALDEIKSMKFASQVETKKYPGSAHGTDLFQATEDDPEPVSGLIVEFLK